MAARPESKDVTKQIVCKPGIMEPPTMNNWNDDRLDEFSRRTDESFTEVKAEMRESFAQVDQRFEKVDQRFDKVDQEFKDVRADIKDVRQEMKEGFAQMRGDMNQRLNILTGFIAALIAAVVGAGILG